MLTDVQVYLYKECKPQDIKINYLKVGDFPTLYTNFFIGLIVKPMKSP